VENYWRPREACVMSDAFHGMLMFCNIKTDFLLELSVEITFKQRFLF
jgi:hypothetical protein